MTGHGLYRAEHRARRELHAVARQLSGHWQRLAERIGGPPAAILRHGAGAARELLDELDARTAEHGLHGFPAAQGAGGRLAGVRNNAGDLLLERNQALRIAVLDVQHLTTLLGYLGRLATTRGDEQLAAFHLGWEARLREFEDDAREAAIALGCEPAAAVVPADQGPLGRAGHRVATAVGGAGEALDSSRFGRAARAIRP
jgi:type VI protein secretion system component VasF